MEYKDGLAGSVNLYVSVRGCLYMCTFMCVCVYVTVLMCVVSEMARVDECVWSWDVFTRKQGAEGEIKKAGGENTEKKELAVARVTSFCKALLDTWREMEERVSREQSSHNLRSSQIDCP